MADPATPDPGYIQRLINGLKGLGTSAYNAISPRANPAAPLNPNDPSTAEGKGGAARKAALDKAIADAGG